LEAMLKDLVIYQRTQDYLLWIHGVVSNFPRSEKYNLGSEIERLTLSALRSIIRANYEVEKMETLCGVIVELELQKVLLRNARMMGLIDNRRYETASRSLVEIGKLLFGWMKSEKRRKAAGGSKAGVDGRNVFGNFYLSLNSEKEGSGAGESPSADLLREGIEDMNRKMEGRKSERAAAGPPAGADSGVWLFSEPGKK
jgi:hypothetical protein